MTQTFVELLLLVPAALCTGFVIFVAGVIQGLMDDMDEATFKSFLDKLTRKALHSPYVIGVSSLTFAGMIPYFILYGVSNLWFTAGLVLWIITSIVSKVTVLPVYKSVASLGNTNTIRLNEERRKLHKLNILRAALSFASVVLMMFGFI